MVILFFHQAQMGSSVFRQHQDHRTIKERLIIEYELAYLFQMLAPDFRGQRLLDIELSNLALCLNGAMRMYLKRHPERRLRAVLFSHRNIVAAWELKQRLEDAFQAYLNVTDYKPINHKAYYDFSGVDLIFTTVAKDIFPSPSIPTLHISDAPDADFTRYQGQIRMLALNNVFPRPDRPLKTLLEEAYWHERSPLTDRFQIIRALTADFLDSGIMVDDHYQDILQRETESSFAVKPGIVFLHTLLPASPS